MIEIPQMNKLWILILPLAMLMTACGVEDDDEEEVEEIRLMHRSTDDVTDGSVDSSRLYDFVLTANGSTYTLSGELNDIKITGDSNKVYFGENLTFDKLVITGDSNQVLEEGPNKSSVVAVDTFVDTGANNDVSLSSITTSIDASSTTVTEATNESSE